MLFRSGLWPREQEAEAPELGSVVMLGRAMPVCPGPVQEAGQVVWDFHLFQNFPQFIVIHTVKGFGIVNKAEIDVFLKVSCFFDDPTDVGNLISGSSAFSKASFVLLASFKHTTEQYKL